MMDLFKNPVKSDPNNWVFVTVWEKKRQIYSLRTVNNTVEHKNKESECVLEKWTNSTLVFLKRLLDKSITV